MRDYLLEQWDVLRDEVILEWPAIPDNEMAWVEGDLDRLIAVIQLHHGLTDEEALNRISDFLERARV